MSRFDGTKISLTGRSKRPLSKHPNAHTDEELKNIKKLRGRNKNIGLSELYGKLKRKYNYTRHPASLFRLLRKQGVYMKCEHIKNDYKSKVYNTPIMPGIKMQLDVKHVPKKCYSY